MSRISVRLLCIPAVLALVVAATTVNPTALAGAENLNDADLFAAADDPALTAVNRDLSARLEAVAVRTTMKEELVDRLLAGRVGLGLVAERFVELNEQAPECLDGMRRIYPASDVRESAAQSVLEYARQRTPEADWPRVQARLLGEYRAVFHHTPQH